MDALGATEATESAHQDASDSSTFAKPLNQDNPPNPLIQGETEVESGDDHDHNEEDTETETQTENGDGDNDEEEEEEDDEPHFKYAYVTKQLGAVYRNGDATSAFLAAGDKMLIGTHNGNIHVLSLPTFKPLRVYHAHSASVTSISLSPFPLLLPTLTDDLAFPTNSSSGASSVRGQPRSTHPSLPATPSNSIHIASSSIDGNVCVTSLVDQKDVHLRNFGRPVQAVALSPEYKSDRTFLSGGRAGDLILTTGGKMGGSANSTTMGGAAAAASSWFGAMGLGPNTGKDTILHSGEGAISVIKWSLTGKYVAWVNEEGIKIMRSNLHLESVDPEYAWKRVGHIDRPNLLGWEEMAGVWKARAEWVDEDSLSSEAFSNRETPLEPSTPTQSTVVKERVEKLVVGWGGTVWVINVYADRPSKSNKDQKIGLVEVSTILRTDCIISGISLYTPSLLVILAYMEAETNVPEDNATTRRRPKAMEPELRIIDIDSKEELRADVISVSRFENLTASDYHMCVLPPWKTVVPVAQRGALEAIGTGIWDATMYPARLFSSGASIRSNTSSGDKGSSRALSTSSRRLPDGPLPKEVQDISGSTAAKIFVHSPYDCVAALQRDLSDHLAWLNMHNRYDEAWKLLDEHPEAAGSVVDVGDALSTTPGRSQSSLGDFFADDTSSITTIGRGMSSAAAELEKRRVGELWVGQLIDENKWQDAARVCAKAVGTTSRWEHWAWKFIKSDKYDEISSVLPVGLHPALSSKIYEAILEHYIAHDREKLGKLLDLWPFEGFDVDSVTKTIEEQLDNNTVASEMEGWHILTNCLARLYLAGGHYSEALRCYIRLQDADTAMSLIKDHRLLDALSDDIPAFIMIRVSREQMKSAPISELEEVTAEPIKLLVSEAYTGIVPPNTVVEQLKAANKLLFLFFYLRALWRGESLPHGAQKPRRGHSAHIRDAASKLAADEGKALVDHFADIAAELFADYDRPLLMEFLQASTSYSFETAVSICEQRHFTPELIYLLSKTGQTKRALNLILSDLKDISQAIVFAKAQNDRDLWKDLVDYSMDKPRFIHSLLVEAGTSINPIELVKRIPSGLEIEGLREGLTRLIREHDLQASISRGAARVLQSEVAINMDILRRGQRRGIKFNIAEDKGEESPEDKPNGKNDEDIGHSSAPQAGMCAGCHLPFHAHEKEILVAFACGHCFHLSHVYPPKSPSSTHSPGSESAVQTPRPFAPSRTPTLDEISLSASRTVGPKVTTARLLRDRIGNGCRMCAFAKELDAIGDSDA